jgi:transcriptional regulator with XRE-family HTH domain
MSNERMDQSDLPELGGRPGARSIVFERLIDQIVPGRAHVPPELRAARRACGRWLLLRRAARQLSLAEVAERTGLAEGLVELLEQGLVGPELGAEEGWLRLGLVLERHQVNDLPRVAGAIAVARGVAAALDGALVAELEAEMATPDEELAPARPAPAETTQELIDILAAIRLAGTAATAYQIKKGVAERGGKSWNPADLPRTMAALAQDGLVTRSEGRPASYGLTQAGVEILALAAERERAREAERRAQDIERRTDAAIAFRLRPLASEM